jgi:hypothetical protein
MAECAVIQDGGELQAVKEMSPAATGMNVDDD